MTLRLTIDIFSGRPNPVLEFSGKDAKAILERVRPVRRLSKAEAVPPFESILGYRGLVVEQIGTPAPSLPKRFRLVHGDLFGPRLAHRAADEEFDEFIIQRADRLKIGKGFSEYLRRAMVSSVRVRAALHHWKPPHWPNREHCKCAPLYEPQWWNDGWGGQKQQNNNCYNYSTNYRTDTFAQPGRAAGAQYTYPPTCANVRPAAVADSLIDTPSANNRCPRQGHLVALVIAPGWDYHWFRKGRNGYWTHKPGSTPATNVDSSGNLITDPRTANRGFIHCFLHLHGRYAWPYQNQLTGPKSV